MKEPHVYYLHVFIIENVIWRYIFLQSRRSEVWDPLLILAKQFYMMIQACDCRRKNTDRTYISTTPHVPRFVYIKRNVLPQICFCCSHKEWDGNIMWQELGRWGWNGKGCPSTMLGQMLPWKEDIECSKFYFLCCIIHLGIEGYYLKSHIFWEKCTLRKALSCLGVLIFIQNNF